MILNVTYRCMDMYFTYFKVIVLSLSGDGDLNISNEMRVGANSLQIALMQVSI